MYLSHCLAALPRVPSEYLLILPRRSLCPEGLLRFSWSQLTCQLSNLLHTKPHCGGWLAIVSVVNNAEN